MKDAGGLFFGEIFYMRIKVIEAPEGDENDTSDPDTVAPSDPHIEDEDEGTTAVNRLQTGMNINPDAPHSNPMNSEEFKGLERDRGLARRFQKIDILEPTVEETIQIAKKLG